MTDGGSEFGVCVVASGDIADDGGVVGERWCVFEAEGDEGLVRDCDVRVRAWDDVVVEHGAVEWGRVFVSASTWAGRGGSTWIAMLGGFHSPDEGSSLAVRWWSSARQMSVCRVCRRVFRQTVLAARGWLGVAMDSFVWQRLARASPKRSFEWSGAKQVAGWSQVGLSSSRSADL